MLGTIQKTLAKAEVMLLTEERKQAIVKEIVKKAQDILTDTGELKRDQENLLDHTECRIDDFLIIQHQRQESRSGKVTTSGLDLWKKHEHGTRKVLCVRYLPFEIKTFSQFDGGAWVETFLNLETSPQNSPLL